MCTIYLVDFLCMQNISFIFKLNRQCQERKKAARPSEAFDERSKEKERSKDMRLTVKDIATGLKRN